MKNKDYIQELILHFEKNENEPILISEEKILNEFQKNNENHSLAIKILSVFGGIMASIAFSVFIGITGIYEMDFVSIVLGFTLIGFGLVANKNIENILIDTLSISVFIIGYILIGIGFSSLGSSENTITTVILLTALGSIIFVQNFMIAFISILVINGCFITLMIANDFADLIQIYVSILAFLLAELFLNEAKFIKMNTAMSVLFNPLKIGLLLSFLITLILLAVKWFLELSTDYLWISSIPIIFIIIYFLKHLTKTLKINDKTTKLKIYILSILLLSPTILAPAIVGSILIILLCFYANYKTGLVIGIIAFIYFLSQYYYDLNFTLLTKSIVLFITGILFIALYLFSYKKLHSDEKI